MADLKLSRLPDRIPVKITISVLPDLNKALQIYAELYRETYGEEEPVATLIPYMLQSFLDADRNFVKTFREKSAITPLPDTNAPSGARHQRQPHREVSSISN